MAAIRLGPHWGTTQKSVLLSLTPLFHVAGFLWAFIALTHGARLVLATSAEAGYLVRLINDEGVTAAFLVPTLVKDIVARLRESGNRCDTLGIILYGASPIAESVLREALERLQCDFVQLYGLTETAGPVAELAPGDHLAAPELLRSCGRAYDWTEIMVADLNTGKPVDPGVPGEIWTRAEQNMLGYWNKPDETARTITDGWLRTGDVAIQSPEGYLYLLDRSKDVIISGGENLYPAEIENILQSHPDVSDVAVIGVPDPKWGEAAKAIVVPTRPGDFNADRVLSFARERLAGFKVPKSIDLVDELPRNATGKILKPVLRRKYWEGHQRSVH